MGIDGHSLVIWDKAVVIDTDIDFVTIEVLDEFWIEHSDLIVFNDVVASALSTDDEVDSIGVAAPGIAVTC